VTGATTSTSRYWIGGSVAASWRVAQRGDVVTLSSLVLLPLPFRVRLLFRQIRPPFKTAQWMAWHAQNLQDSG
jgi:hypothetical protein